MSSADEAAPSEYFFGESIRLAYFESRLFLDSEWKTKTLTALGITRQTVNRDMREYERRYGKKWHYCASSKRYILDRRCRPRIVARAKMAAFARHVESVFAIAVKNQ